MPLLHLELHLPVRHELRIPHHIFQPALISRALLQFLAIKQVLHCRWPVEILYNVITKSLMPWASHGHPITLSVMVDHAQLDTTVLDHWCCSVW